MSCHGIEILFLGTGTSQGVPVIACDCSVCKSENKFDKRLRSSILVRSDSTTVIIDTGPDFRQQMLTYHVKTLDAVVFTHEHKDHIAGLDDIRAYNYVQRKNMPVYCTQWVEKAIRRDFFYAFAETKYPGVPEMEIIPIDENTSFQIGDIPFHPIKVLHHHLPVLGFRIYDFVYITDANYIDNNEMLKLKDARILVLNALRKQSHISHFNLEQALDIMKYISPEQGYLTHISHMMGLHNEVEKGLPSHIRLAHDGLRIRI
ncbi:MAG: MBL fold metallo-hydrolase [Flavobacteriales bacterium]|nr:MBL fold metallo-hydrolase [Flavobacteriales bacterium]MCZ2444487.1 MBL fold metallo-hydrolase [Flavobacteriales bacterium]